MNNPTWKSHQVIALLAFFFLLGFGLIMIFVNHEQPTPSVVYGPSTWITKPDSPIQFGIALDENRLLFIHFDKNITSVPIPIDRIGYRRYKVHFKTDNVTVIVQVIGDYCEFTLQIKNDPRVAKWVLERYYPRIELFRLDSLQVIT